MTMRSQQGGIVAVKKRACNEGFGRDGNARLHAHSSCLLRGATLPTRPRCEALPLTLAQQQPTIYKQRQKQIVIGTPSNATKDRQCQQQ
jgi:hypothetical protein